jgi:hypothetical protein
MMMFPVASDRPVSLHAAKQMDSNASASSELGMVKAQLDQMHQWLIMLGLISLLMMGMLITLLLKA